MKIFTDAAGRQWPFAINVYTVGRVKAALSLHLPSLFAENAKPLAELLSSEERLAAVIYELGREENEAAGRKFDDLAKLFAGEAADALTDLFLEELVDFFRDPKRRQALRQALKTMKEVGARLIDKSLASQPTAAEMDAAAEDLIRRLTSDGELTPISGPAPASSGSTQAA